MQLLPHAGVCSLVLELLRNFVLETHPSERTVAIINWTSVVDHLCDIPEPASGDGSWTRFVDYISGDAKIGLQSYLP